MSANDDDIIGKPFFALGPHRIRTKGEEPLDLDTHPVAYFEAVWGEEVYGWNAVVRDTEDMRRGGDGVELAPPRTDYEREMLVRHVRAVANDMARVFNLAHLIRQEDDLE
jgi:hypothetical protein